MALKVFISYRRADANYPARMIYNALCAVLPRDDVFMDVDSIPLGADFVETLEGWVEKCEILLALIGPGWTDAIDPKTSRKRLQNDNDFVRVEIREALKRGINVVPVLLDGTPMPDPEDLPDDLKRLVRRQAQFVDFRTFDADVGRLLKKLGLKVTKPRRLAAALLRLAERRKFDSASQTIAITQQEIGELVGMTGKSVNKQLRAWAARKWVGLEQGTLVVLDANSLRKLAEGGSGSNKKR
jgi:hypothetical protein